MIHSQRSLAHFGTAACLGLVLLLVGCKGGSSVPTGKVTGKVTYNGQPVKGGSLTFAPIAAEGVSEPGAPAGGTVADDGTYTAEGVVIGKHTVSYSPPSAPAATPQEGGHTAPTAPSEYAGLKPKEQSYEVKDGATVDIELIK